MTRDELNILLLPEVRNAIEENIGRDPLRVALDRHVPHARVVASQVKYLQRAKSKLPRLYAARAILPDRAFEQSSSDECAAAKRLGGGTLLDLTCGLGVDSMHFAERFERVVALERDEVLADVVRENMRRMGVENVEVVTASAEEYVSSCEEHFDWVYADPDRRTAEGKRAKLNSAYGRNGCGEEGMEWTMTYIQRIIGYRPDGYILVDMELVPKIVDLMGGVDVHLDHHIRVHTDGEEVYVPAGDQHLNGEEVLATLRYRYGYADADLGRVKVQRMVITECMKQWVSPTKIGLLPDALEMVQEESLTDLSVSNFLWVGKTILTGMDSMTSDTLPGYADMRGGASYFVLYPDRVAELINESYNPYTVEIDVDDLTIVE